MRRYLRLFCAFTCVLTLSAIAPLTVEAASAGPNQPASAKPAAELPKVDPEALNALQKMGSYLQSLTSFELRSETTTESVLDNDQKVQFGGNLDYKVRRPDAFVISMSSDRKVRRFYYDGKKFTVFAPRMNFYSTIDAPSTIGQLFKQAYDRYGIEFPLEDLFEWGTTENNASDVTSAILVGYAKIDGQDTDQFAFRQGDSDWQVWIARGDKPLPLKFVIVKTSDDAMPAYSAVLHWNTSATFTDETFAFKPPADARSIKLQPVKVSEVVQ